MNTFSPFLSTQCFYIGAAQTYKHFSLSLSLRAAIKPPPGSYNRDGPKLPLTPSDTR